MNDITQPKQCEQVFSLQVAIERSISGWGKKPGVYEVRVTAPNALRGGLMGTRCEVEPLKARIERWLRTPCKSGARRMAIKPG